MKTDINTYRNTLCSVGRALYDNLPQIPSSYREFDEDNTKYEKYAEEKEFEEHTRKCSVCKVE